MQDKYSTELMQIKYPREKKIRQKKTKSKKEPYKTGEKKIQPKIEKKKSIWKDTIKKKESEFLTQEKTQNWRRDSQSQKDVLSKNVRRHERPQKEK